MLNPTGNSKTYDFASLKSQCREVIEHELGEPDSHQDKYSTYLCPFHGEKTASFRVYEDHFNCYGCGANGDTVDFLQRLHHMTIKQVMEYLGADKNASQESTEEYRRQREAERQQRAEETAAKRAQFTASGIWEQYHRNLNEFARAEWRKAGIDDRHQDKWRFGFVQDKVYEYRDDLYHSPALTIPYSTFVNGRPPEFYTVQFRLLNPVNQSDKYRFEKDLGSGLWVAHPEYHPGERLTRVLLAEGAKKAAVAAILLEGCMQVLGAPSKSGLSNYVEVLKQFEEVYVWMDPDIVERPKSAKADWRPGDELLCSLIPQARFIRYPKKIDDAILQYGISKDNLLDIMRYSSRR